MEGDQEMRHMCKFCDKIFPCGRSLGGHMRSHLIKQSESSSDKTNKKKLSSFCNSNNNEVAFASSAQNGGYSLREKPKKTSKFSNSIGDSFSLEDHHHHESSTSPIRKQRSRNIKRYTSNTPTTNAAISITNNDSPCVSEIEQEQEEVALSLILLSRDVNWFESSKSKKGDSFENVSPTTSISRNGIDFETQQIKKQKAKKKREWNIVDSLSDGKSNTTSYSFVGSSSEKKNKIFSCTCCNKSFHSYQALGGHRATYKKMKGCFGLKIDYNNSSEENSIIIEETEETADSKFININPDEKMKTLDYGSKKKAEKVHECSICFKIFLSGQALGGHKRTHLLAAAAAEAKNKKIPEKYRDFLDLNLPASPPLDHELVDNNAQQEVCCESESPWWIGNIHKQRQLVREGGLFL